MNTLKDGQRITMNKIIIGAIATVVAGLILLATGWNFSAVADMPDKYVTKENHQKDMNRIDKKLDILIEHLIGVPHE